MSYIVEVYCDKASIIVRITAKPARHTAWLIIVFVNLKNSYPVYKFKFMKSHSSCEDVHPSCYATHQHRQICTPINIQCLLTNPLAVNFTVYSNGTPLLCFRTCLPVPMFSRNDFSIWSVLKNSIGKELSKITMPVVFNEPLSFLQRMVEYMEYAPLLNSASELSDPIQRMQVTFTSQLSRL